MSFKYEYNGEASLNITELKQHLVTLLEKFSWWPNAAKSVLNQNADPGKEKLW